MASILSRSLLSASRVARVPAGAFVLAQKATFSSTLAPSIRIRSAPLASDPTPPPPPPFKASPIRPSGQSESDVKESSSDAEATSESVPEPTPEATNPPPSSPGAETPASEPSANAGAKPTANPTPDPKFKAKEEAKKKMNSKLVDKIIYRGAWAIVAGCLVYSALPFSEEERKRAGASDPSLTDRMWARLTDTYVVQPKPLPPQPMLPPPIQAEKPFTLILDLEGILSMTTVDPVKGRKVAIRPGAEYFIKRVHQLYDISVLTSQPGREAMMILDKFDPYQFYIPFNQRLLLASPDPEAAPVLPGTQKKSFENLGRDYEKTVVILTDRNQVGSHEENVLVIPPWKGDASDKALLDLIDLLEALRCSEVDDFRPILKTYANDANPLETFQLSEANRRKAAYDAWALTPFGARAIQENIPSGTPEVQPTSSLSRWFGLGASRGQASTGRSVVPTVWGDKPGPGPDKLDVLKYVIQESMRKLEVELERAVKEEQAKKAEEAKAGEVATV
ncbi:TFIIF-interacting CTD phosphatase, including NLI-interacting factor (involved in RNA polymerase II regulation) [Phaffia rhodozyma]|uniref:Mitochondrial import inner membrane translocase subunit TIM50 n=1 Tax=Phaffia rhodozyma TaxID=264483 RepID=A0A0F7SPV7_PHARH|nr:TFIIF-interacting CTD phosphatase, including NLI-interacting factor (involved in RNA polymerase II regulation) [Phaffia rhodozyma]